MQELDGRTVAIRELFDFKAPPWTNSSRQVTLGAEDALRRARDLSSSYYALATQTGIHSMIEWCGVMSEYVNMLGYAFTEQKVDPREVDQHSGTAISAPEYYIAYICEKLGCQLKPFIKANKSAWRREINRWFEE